MQRRDFLKMAGLVAARNRLVGQQEQSLLAPAGSEDLAKTDFTLQIGPITVELAPNRILSTIGYNGTSRAVAADEGGRAGHRQRGE